MKSCPTSLCREETGTSSLNLSTWWQCTESTISGDWSQCPTQIHSPEWIRWPHCSIHSCNLSWGEGQGSLRTQKLPLVYLSLGRERSLFLYNSYFRCPTVFMFYVLLQPKTRPFQLGVCCLKRGLQWCWQVAAAPITDHQPLTSPSKAVALSHAGCKNSGLVINLLAKLLWKSHPLSFSFSIRKKKKEEEDFLF